MGILAWICGLLCLGFHKLAARAAASTGNRSNSRNTEVGRFWFPVLEDSEVGFLIAVLQRLPSAPRDAHISLLLGVPPNNRHLLIQSQRGWGWREIPSSKTDNKYSCNIMK